MKKNMMVGIAMAMGMFSFGAISASAATGLTADDALITSKVQTAFFQEPILRASRLNVSTSRGVVQLAGVVEQSQDLQAAIQLVGGVPGVVQVKNGLVVVKN